MDKPYDQFISTDREEVLDHCGILGLFSAQPVGAFSIVREAVISQQTRGYDGAGVWMVNGSGRESRLVKKGMMRTAFWSKEARIFEKKSGKIWLLQNRYGTSGSQAQENLQPLCRVHKKSRTRFTVVHNGQFGLREQNLDQQTTSLSDTVLFVNSVASSEEPSLELAIRSELKKRTGAYSLLIAGDNALFAIRDPHGIRPLVYAKINHQQQECWVFASETAVLDKIGAVQIKEVLPGSFLSCSQDGVKILKPIGKVGSTAYCAFESVYIMDEYTKAHIPAASQYEIRNHPTINLVRFRSGQILAKESPVRRNKIEFVCGVPGTGITSGQGFAQSLRLPYIQAIIDRDHKDQEQRTFMTADIDSIYTKVLDHFRFLDVFRDQRVVLVDDSLVRGNITRALVSLLKNEYGAKEVHIKIACPPIDKPCHLGINTRKPEELLAVQCDNDLDRMRETIGADSLAFLSPKGLTSAIMNKRTTRGLCLGCMKGYSPPVSSGANSDGSSIPSRRVTFSSRV